MQIIKRNFNFIAIAFGVVLVWRGMWGLLDIYLFPQNEILSFISSIIFGVILLFFIDHEKKDISEIEYQID